MGNRFKLIILTIITLIAIMVMAFIEPIPQDLIYHQFADGRSILGISNFWNVISNIGFVIFGTYGSIKAFRGKSNWLLWSLLLGIFLTGFGSGYYHYLPNNNTLVLDRLPMVIIFMSFFSFVLSIYLGERWHVKRCVSLMLVGIGSVVYWWYTESIGQGDLRWYALIQFLPMVLIPVILLLYTNKGKKAHYIVYIFGAYILAKLAEHFDLQIYQTLGEQMSGHAIKHVFASIAAYYIFCWMFAYNKTSSKR